MIALRPPRVLLCSGTSKSLSLSMSTNVAIPQDEVNAVKKFSFGLPVNIGIRAAGQRKAEIKFRTGVGDRCICAHALAQAHALARTRTKGKDPADQIKTLGRSEVQFLTRIKHVWHARIHCASSNTAKWEKLYQWFATKRHTVCTAMRPVVFL